MSERRFTRLKASLSETAAKTRETVSRELRQSLNVSQNAFLSCIDPDYEENVRKWEETSKQQKPSSVDDDDDVLDCSTFLVPEDDIQCIDEAKENDLDLNRYYSLDKIKVTSLLSKECIKHYLDSKHLIKFGSMAKFYGTVFDTFITKNSNDINEFFSSKNFFKNSTLRPHVFECDEGEGESGFSGQKMLIREGNALVIGEGESELTNGWLTLSRDEYNCFLTFYNTSRRDKILWHIEVNQKVEKQNRENHFKVNKHVIRTDSNFLDDWIKDINSNICIDFSPEKELNRILIGDNERITEHLKSFDLINGINIFAAYSDLNSRKGSINKFNNEMDFLPTAFSPTEPNSLNCASMKTFDLSKVFRFLLTLKTTDIAQNDRNRFNDSYIFRISLFDAKLGKLSEEFRYVVSTDLQIIRPSTTADQNRNFDQRLMSNVSRALFTADLNSSNPNDLFLVARVERTSHRLSNYICSPILASTSASATANNNNNKVAHSNLILQHVEPYAWAVRPLFIVDSSCSLEMSSNFGLFYKMDQNRLSDEFILNVLNQHSQGTSRSQTAINAKLEIGIIDYKVYVCREMKTDSATSDVIFSPSLFPTSHTKPDLVSSSNKKIDPILEIQSLRLLPQPHTEFFNILYIYPQTLKFDSQKIFSKARNLCVTIEIRDSDDINDSKPLKVIFGRPHDSSLFVTTATTACSRHNMVPDFYEEIKIALPLNFSDKLHILFTFSHISCKKECMYTIVGYSWLPISSEKHQVHCQNLNLSVFASLPNNYLSCQLLGLGKGLSIPDVKFVGKDVFKVSSILISSIISRDYDLHNTMSSILQITCSNRNDSKEISHIISLERQIPKMLDLIPTCDNNELIHFSQVILQQLFRLIVYAASQELIRDTLNTIFSLVDKYHIDGNLYLLKTFIDSTFQTTEFGGVYIHEQLLVLLRSFFVDFCSKSYSRPAEIKIVLNNLWFVLQIILKSMVQFLFVKGRIKLKREDRFDDDLTNNLKLFFESISNVVNAYSRLEEAQNANRALSYFMTRLCSFFDRSIIFNAFYHHVNVLSSRDVLIQELKLYSIAALLSHEHYVSYCNAQILSDTIHLTSDYCKLHFPVFLMLNEFKTLYHQSATTVRQVRQLALLILRNQLAKHMFDSRYSSFFGCRQRILALYLPILTAILENSSRMIDLCVLSSSNTAYNSNVKSNSPFSTLRDSVLLDGLNSFLVRSSSEISSTLSSMSSYNSLSSTSTITSVPAVNNTHNRTNSTITTVRFDKFNQDEIRDLFVCFLCVVQVLNIDQLNLFNSKQLRDLFLCLECALNCFEYKPHRQLTTDCRSKTMPNPITNSNNNNNLDHSIISDNLTSYLLQQNLSIQTSLITLRVIHLYLDNDSASIDGSVSQILSIYLTLMTLPQSQSVLIQVFNSIRYFVRKFSVILFNSDTFLSPIICKVIKYCNSALTPIRQGATDLLYCLFATNLKRTRFETIVCVSRLASSDPHGLLYLHSSLNRIEQMANADMSCMIKSISNHYGECEEEESSIINVVERIREILKATKQIREDSFDPYVAAELRLQLANSYARTSRSLLRTWLENLSEVHVKNNDWAEAALCHCQVIAILIEQLSSKEINIIDGMLNISKVSGNIMTKYSIKRESDWLELEESHVSLDVLESIIKECTDLFEKAELFELAPHVLKVMISSYERDYEHNKLNKLCLKMARMHSKAQEINDSGKRIFDTFFRVSFYYINTGQKASYIYKLPKVVSLSEMTTKMQTLYSNATFLASDSPAVQQIESNLKQEQQSQIGNGDVSHNHTSQKSQQSTQLIIVVTHVTPFVDNARNNFERNIGVQHFVYEQRLDGKIAQTVAEQYKKRVILTTENTFPFFLKRIPVISKKEIILNPIEVAIDEMQERVHQLEHVIMTQDAKHLQLVLQGSIHVTVNCGPLAYANAFLRTSFNNDSDKLDSIETNQDDQDRFNESQRHLKILFEQFLDLCESALKLNEKLIKSNQIDYHNNLKANFEKLKNQLDFLHVRPTSIQIFDVISGSTYS